MKAIRYITKYFNKCNDVAIFAIGNRGEQHEVKLYQSDKYIFSNEATWKIFGFDIHK